MSELTQTEQAILEAALNLPPKERPAYLDQACAGDGELRQRIIEGLFKAGDTITNSPAQQAASPPADTIAIPFVPPPGEKAGDRIGPYKLLQEIGGGGMGEVWMAEQQQPYRRVALKLVKLGMDTKQVLARFRAEQQALALMDHPNIAKVFEAGATENGRPYFVMELVRGIPITEYCDKEKLSTEERLGLFVQVCQAIQHAHQKGVIHRDIKPSNILVTMLDGVPVPKVIDFGIAKATQGKLVDETLFTAFEQFIGTPAYMSPEQAEMNALDIDTRSDIYSLGVLLYELLSGKTPFDSRKLLEAGLDEIRRVIREVEPPRPSARLSTLDAEQQTTVARDRHSEPPKLLGLIRGDLDWIVMRCLEKDRRRRYETANGLARDIERHLNNEAVNARPPSRAYRLEKLVRRNKLVFAAAGAVTAALIIGLGVATWMFVREKQAHERALTAESTAKTEAKKCQQVAEFLKDMLGGVGPSVALGRDTTMLREILDKTAKRVAKDLNEQPTVEAELRATMGSIYFQLGEYASAEAMQREALRLRRSVLGQTNPVVADSLSDLAETVEARGDLHAAETTDREVLEMRKKVLGGKHQAVARSLHSLARVFWRQGAWASAEATYREALAIQRNLPANEGLDLAATLNDLGLLLRDDGKLSEAAAVYREALSVQRRLLGDENPEVAATLNNLANVFYSQGKLDEAEALIRDTLAMKRKLLGNEHPSVAISLHLLANVLWRQRRLGEAETVYREALAMHERLLPNRRDTATLVYRFANLLREEGKLPEAETLFREAVPMHQRLFGEGYRRVTESLRGLAQVLRDQGKLNEAEATEGKLAKQILKAAQQTRKAAEAGDAEALNNLAWLLATSDSSGVRDFRSALSFAEKAVAATSRTNAVYLDTLAAASAEAGDFPKAISIQKEALALLRDEKLRQDFATRLKLYEAHTAYREKQQ